MIQLYTCLYKHIHRNKTLKENIMERNNSLASHFGQLLGINLKLIKKGVQNTDRKTKKEITIQMAFNLKDDIKTFYQKKEQNINI